jgi:hypothetical protein
VQSRLRVDCEGCQGNHPGSFVEHLVTLDAL